MCVAFDAMLLLWCLRIVQVLVLIKAGSLKNDVP